MIRAPALAPKEFFGGLRKGVKAALPPELRAFELGRGHSRLLKLHYRRPDVHFEAWHHPGAGRLELGSISRARPPSTSMRSRTSGRGWSR